MLFPSHVAHGYTSESHGDSLNYLCIFQSHLVCLLPNMCSLLSHSSLLLLNCALQKSGVEFLWVVVFFFSAPPLFLAVQLRKLENNLNMSFLTLIHSKIRTFIGPLYAEDLFDCDQDENCILLPIPHPHPKKQ